MFVPNHSFEVIQRFTPIQVYLHLPSSLPVYLHYFTGQSPTNHLDSLLFDYSAIPDTTALIINFACIMATQSDLPFACEAHIEQAELIAHLES